MKTLNRISLSLALASFLFLLSMPYPAQACGCGMVLPKEGAAGITQERAIIRWDGRVEDIVMALQVQGDAREAAWIMPLPTPAKVKLGDPKMFDVLQEFTKPREETDYALFPTVGLGAGAPGARAVTLLSREEIGVYDVSTLAATDAKALTDWLNANGYKFPPHAAPVLKPYVDQGWFYIAARITPSRAKDALGGELDPLWMTFQSDRIVYPMRPNALARQGLGIYLYILAEHRVTIDGLDTAFAGWIEPGALNVAAEHPIRQVVDRRYFLTKLETYIYNPAEQVKDDYYARVVPDELYRKVVYHTVYDVGGVPLCLIALAVVAGMGTLGLLAVGGLATLVLRQRR